MKKILSGVVVAAALVRKGVSMTKEKDTAKETLKNVGSYELAGSSLADRHFKLAIANAQSAKLLCSQVVEQQLENTWSQASVIYSLHYHAYELFYKGAIAILSDKVEAHHKINELRERYSALKPDGGYDVPDHFVIKIFAHKENKYVKKSLDKLYYEMDQSFRYHADRKGQPWEGIHAFKAAEYQELLDNSADAFARVAKLLLERKVKNIK